MEMPMRGSKNLVGFFFIGCYASFLIAGTILTLYGFNSLKIFLSDTERGVLKKEAAAFTGSGFLLLSLFVSYFIELETAVTAFFLVFFTVAFFFAMEEELRAGSALAS